MSKLRWILMRLARKLGVRVALYAVFGVFAAVAASLATRFVTWPVPFDISTEAIEGSFAGEGEILR